MAQDSVIKIHQKCQFWKENEVSMTQRFFAGTNKP